MKKKLFKTLFIDQSDNYYPDVDGEESNSTKDKNFSIAITYIFYKKLYNKEPKNTELANFRKKIEAYNLNIESFKTFDQATVSRNHLLKKLKDNQFEYDFLILKDWEIKIQDSKSLLIQEISERLKNGNENYQHLIKLFHNTKPVYCNFLEYIKESIASIKKPEKYLNDIYNILEIDFSLINEFLQENNFVDISPNKNIIENSLVSNLVKESFLIPLQQEISPMQLIKDEWQPIKISSENQFSHIFLDNPKDEFEKFEKIIHKNLLILKGKEGSGKSFLSLYIALGALANNFTSKFISIDIHSSFEKMENDLYKFLSTHSQRNTFIVIDGITNLNLNVKSKQVLSKLIKFFDDLANKITKNCYVLFTANQDSLLYQKVFSELLLQDFQTFRINDLQTSPEWITTIMEKTIFETSKQNIKSNFSIYYLYLTKVLEINSLKLDLDKNTLHNILCEIAFKSFKGKPKLGDLNQLQKIIDFLYYNPICQVDRHNMNIVTFNHDIFRYILAGEYLLKNPYQAKYIINQNNFKDDQWRVLFKYFSERLDACNSQNFIDNPILIRGIIFHLRRSRDLVKAETFLSYIIDSEQKEQEKDYLILENAKRFYNRLGDYQKCLQTLLEIKNPELNPQLYYEYLIQISSCTLDLFLPISTINLINIYLESNSIIADDPRLYGNLSRAYLRSGDYINAKKYLIKKLKIHQENNNLSDENRDKVELILINAFEYRQTKDSSLYKESLDLFDEVISFYDHKEKQQEMSYLGEKVFAYKNISYFLSDLDHERAEALINKLFLITNLDIYEKAPQGIIFANLGCYYYSNSNLLEALACINKAVNCLKTYNIELSFVWYLHYFITRDKDSKIISLNHYQAYQQHLLFTQVWINENIKSHNKENSCISFSDFELKKLNLLDFSIF